MKRYARLWWACLRQAIRRDLQFRSQTLINAVASIGELGLGLIPVLILTGTSASAVGWNGPLTLVVVGLYGACTGLMDCFVAPNLRRIDGYVRKGDLDLILVRPVNAQLFATLRWMGPAELGRVVTGLGLAAAGAHAAHLSLTPGLVIRAGVWVGDRLRRFQPALGEPGLPRVLDRECRADQRGRDPAPRGRQVPADVLPEVRSARPGDRSYRRG